ncbi:MAG: hypothetical protein IJ719_05320 [Clostridia bacterium]|nr:hypothetical protein [Clostridia bacterium]
MAERRRKAEQKRKKEKQKRMLSILLCVIGSLTVLLISITFSLYFFDIEPEDEPEVAVKVNTLPYDKEQPFSVADLTPEQMNQLRTQGKLHLSDGPREISIGDPLEKILEHYPSGFQEKKLSDEQTGEQSDEQQILYCSAYYRNNSGKMTALPPRGLLNVDAGSITVTLLAPTSPYPPGTKDDYGKYEHVYCVYTLEPNTMTVSSILLGIDQ